MNEQEFKEKLELHKKWINGEQEGVRLNLQRVDLHNIDLQGAYLQGAYLRGADLQGADLRGADIDFSCLSLWCGDLDFKIDEKQAKQLMYHVINLMQYSNLNVNKIVKKEMFKWLSDSHLVKRYGLPVLKEKIK